MFDRGMEACDKAVIGQNATLAIRLEIFIFVVQITIV